MYDKTKFIYVGLDLHKEQHTAVIMDCFNEKLGEITFQNKSSAFEKLVTKCKTLCCQIEEVDKAISDFLPRFECTLSTIPGVNDITVAKLLSEIGDIRRFPNADKLANFAGVAIVRFPSAGKGDDKPSKQGNRRRLVNIIYGMLKNKTEYQMLEIRKIREDGNQTEPIM